ncbi:MAG: chemotaxis protein CheD [Candidatus Goldbacteria bacterium]|nr:chemotaxis protein CheD [Candidatus Goldiibacteriota bacterium]
MGALKVTNNPADRLITYSLGSCLGVAIYDPVAKVAGLLHAQLPQSSLNREKAFLAPSIYVDTGIPLLFEKAYALGAEKKRIILKLAGATTKGDSEEFFKIGERNYIIARKLLWKNQVFISGEDVGGNIARTISIDAATGIVIIKSGGIGKIL